MYIYIHIHIHPHVQCKDKRQSTKLEIVERGLNKLKTYASGQKTSTMTRAANIRVTSEESRKTTTSSAVAVNAWRRA